MKLMYIIAFFFYLSLIGCTLPAEENPNPGPEQNIEAVKVFEEKLHAELDALESDADYTLLIKAENGRIFAHSIGESTTTSIYPSASISKWVAATVILLVVQKGYLSLESYASEYIDFWAPSEGSGLSAIKLKHLLNFTSGLIVDNITNSPNQDPTISDQVGAIYYDNLNSPTTLPKPGQEFYYASTHLQVAGLMTINALNAALSESISNWQDVFSWFKRQTGLFPSFQFSIPNANNPLLAGGMRYNAQEYFDFLEALYNKQVIEEPLYSLMMSDQLGLATITDNLNGAPTRKYLGEDWHYAFGAWIECHLKEFNCDIVSRISSPGAYGAYPFIDFENRFFGILARQGDFGSYPQGYRFFEQISPRLNQWAKMNSLDQSPESVEK